MGAITWLSEGTERGVRERRFDLEVDDHVVPAIVWTPDDDTRARPLVLFGHGGSEHKRVGVVLALARRFVRHHGFAAASIDAPGHGDRSDGLPPLRERSIEEARASSRMATADWKATLDALRLLPDVGEGPIGWWGLSMGTVLGVPFVAREPRVQTAVFGLMGLRGEASTAFAVLASRITIPILYIVQLEDERASRDGSLQLFDAFGSTDKRMHANPGAHSAVPREEMDASEAFLAKHLTPAALPA